MAIPMLFRFSLYGFLKNQQYFEPFLILAFREKGLSFTMIGVLIGFRELCVNVMEVPTGVVADLCGRRRAMALSFTAYVISFVIFGTSTVLWHLFVAMFCFAVGEAFRTGTHKAMILEWLRLQGREDDKTRTYGFTRSWSNIGSAVSVVIAAALVFYRGRYSDIFLFSIIPYTLALVNFLGYPRELDGHAKAAPSVRHMLATLGGAYRQVFCDGRLRRVLLESMAYEGVFLGTRKYLQPVLKQMAIALPLMAAVAVEKRTAVLVGIVYFVLHIASSAASRRSHALAVRSGGESQAARRLWLVTFVVFIPMALALWLGMDGLAAAGFVVLALLHNLWRPILITRVDNETDAKMGATMLSIESQFQSTGEMVLAPVLGFLVDRLAASPEQPALWVVGVAGAAIVLVGALVPTMKPAPAEPSG